MFNLVPYLSVIENVTMPCYFSQRRYQNVINSAKNLAEEAQRLLDHVGLSGNDVLNKPVTELSVGQQQRVAVARALVNNPEIIFADEPSGNLDSESAENLHSLFFKLRNQFGQTFIIVTHNAELANLADRKLVMVDGKIIDN